MTSERLDPANVGYRPESVAPPVHVGAPSAPPAQDWSWGAPANSGPAAWTVNGAAAPAASSPPKSRRWRWAPRSLTARLVTGVVALVVVLVLAIGISTYLALRAFLFDRLDQQVNTSAAQGARMISGCLNGPTCPHYGGLRAEDPLWITALDAQGGALVLPSAIFEGPAALPESSESVQLMQLTSGERRSLIRDQHLRTLRSSDGHELRVRVIPLTATTASGPTPSLSVYVVVGLSTTEVGKTLHRLLIVEVIIGACALIIALLVTTYGVQFSLRRLRRVTATAHEVAADLSPDGTALQRRVPVTEIDGGTEVGQLATSVNTLLGAVETQFNARLESERRMRQFLADASHELRTPLTSIRGYAELARMQRQVQGADADDNLDRIESEGTRMSRLIEDLLLLARSDRAAEGVDLPGRRELLDLDVLLDEAVAGARASYPDREISLTVPPRQQLVADPDQLLRLVRNLINNAAVHTRPEGAIQVSAAREGGQVAIRVRDAGPGLPPEEAAHVFERFWRADKARTRARGGTGLGMSIVASIVAAHGGTVSFDSSVAGGSTVTVRLPAS